MKWRERVEYWRRRYGPKVVDALVEMSVWQARAKLEKLGSVSVLVDNNVLGHGVIHETAWVSTGLSKWGGVEPIHTGYAARIPVHDETDRSETYQSICFLPGIVCLARSSHVALRTSAELKSEQLHQPAGRFQGYGYLDYSLFAAINFESVDGIAFPTLSSGAPPARQQQLDRVEGKSDALYRDLKRSLGEKNSLDAWHIRTAEVHGIDYFLTMDFRLLRLIEQLADKEPFASLKTRVVSPLQFGTIYDLIRVPPRLFVYHDSRFKVRADLSWGDGRRRRPRAREERMRG